MVLTIDINNFSKNEVLARIIEFLYKANELRITRKHCFLEVSLFRFLGNSQSPLLPKK